MKFKSMAVAILASTVSTLAMADMYTLDLSVSGDRLLLVDSQTNLAWLNLNQTLGLSLDQVAAAGWFDQGFGLATQAQVDTLMVAVSGVPFLGVLGGQLVYKSTGGVEWRTPSLMGAIAGDFLVQGGPIPVKTFEYGPILTPPQGSESVPGDRGWYWPGDLGTSWRQGVTGSGADVPSYEVFATTTATWLGTQDSTPGAGVFLLRTLPAVPEPTTWLLMGLGLVALSIARSRHHPG